jgi:hypothetical protein
VENTDIIRELEKIAGVLGHVSVYLKLHNEANATLHMSNEVMYSPLTSAAGIASKNLIALINRLKEENG